jgi:type II restriction enzyme
LKTKFARFQLGILKATQAITPEKWKYVPLQDFTSKSDIDWTKSVHEIDLQLYKKYGLSKEEKDFIETHVKEMV